MERSVRCLWPIIDSSKAESRARPFIELNTLIKRGSLQRAAEKRRRLGLITNRVPQLSPLRRLLFTLGGMLFESRQPRRTEAVHVCPLARKLHVCRSQYSDTPITVSAASYILDHHQQGSAISGIR